MAAGGLSSKAVKLDVQTQHSLEKGIWPLLDIWFHCVNNHSKHIQLQTFHYE